MNIFETAARNKYRFETRMGMVTVEDLWDLGLPMLDLVAIDLNKKLEESPTESFINPNVTENKHTRAEFDIVKHVIDVKLEEAVKAKDEVLNSQKKQKILAAISELENNELSEKPIEDLRDMLKEL